MKDLLNIIGTVTFQSYSKDGVMGNSMVHNNLITTAGKEYFVKKISNNQTVNNIQINTLAVGYVTTSELPGPSDFGLGNEIYRQNINISTSAENRLLFITNIDETDAQGSINEAGLFTTNDMLIAKIRLNTPFVKSEELLTITWQIQLG